MGQSYLTGLGGSWFGAGGGGRGDRDDIGGEVGSGSGGGRSGGGGIEGGGFVGGFFED